VTLAFVATLNAQTCILTPELTVGPYYYDVKEVRQNITDGKPGVPFVLELSVFNQITCQPLNASAIDIWHCDAGGLYSWFNVANTTFLRGVQFSDAKGRATFDTIYPGWYQGRDTHIHIRLRLGGNSSLVTNTSGNYQGGTIVHTGQLFIDDSINDAVAMLKPYNENTVPRTPNEKDGIYNQGGAATLLNISLIDPKQGYPGGVYARVTLLVNSSANFTDGNGPNPPPPGPPPPGPPPPGPSSHNRGPSPVGEPQVFGELTSAAHPLEFSFWSMSLCIVIALTLGIAV